MADIDYSQNAILVVEHTEVYRGILKKILMDIGANDIRVTSTGKEAIASCQENQYDIVFCDFDLGRGKTGLQVLEELRFIVLSCLEHKPNIFITKPFTHNDLKSRLDKVFQQQNHLRKTVAAMDNQEFKAALFYCEQELKAGTRYEIWCLKTRCELLFKLKAYEACIILGLTFSWVRPCVPPNNTI